MSTPKKRPSARAKQRESAAGLCPPVIYARVSQRTKDRLDALVAAYGGTVGGYLDQVVWLLPDNAHAALAALHGQRAQVPAAKRRAVAR